MTVKGFWELTRHDYRGMEVLVQQEVYTVKSTWEEWLTVRAWTSGFWCATWGTWKSLLPSLQQGRNWTNWKSTALRSSIWELRLQGRLPPWNLETQVNTENHGMQDRGAARACQEHMTGPDHCWKCGQAGRGRAPEPQLWGLGHTLWVSLTGAQWFLTGEDQRRILSCFRWVRGHLK